jgi:putative membrane protein
MATWSVNLDIEIASRQELKFWLSWMRARISASTVTQYARAFNRAKNGHKRKLTRTMPLWENWVTIDVNWPRAGALGRAKPSKGMIKNFGDHSANERTLLAWVRTAIAVMAFGFLVEKFDLFLEAASPSLAGRTLSLPGQKFGSIAGLSLIVLGIAMVAIAALRFLKTAKTIDSDELRPSPGSRVDLALAALLVLLGCALFVYLSHALVTSRTT